MTASLQTKHDKVYVVLCWKQGTKQKQKWVQTTLPLKYGKRAGEAEKERVLEEWCDKIEQAPQYREKLFSQFLLDWCEYKRDFIEETTYNEYRRMIQNSINPYFDQRGIQLQQCGVAEIEDFYSYKRNHDHVSENTISHYQAAIFSAFKDGVRKGIVASNPAEKVTLKKARRFHGKFYNVDETKKLLSIIQGTKMEIPVFLACWFGMRRGEISGLRWQDIDFTTNTLSISGVIVQAAGDGSRFKYRPSPKSEAGNRSFCLSDTQIRTLKSWRAKQSEQRLLLGCKYDMTWDGFVCRDQEGKLITPEYISYTFPKLLKKADLAKIRFHDLRHTNAVLLLSNGATMQDVQNWLGHESYSTTDMFYGGILQESKKRTSMILQDVLAAGG